MSLQPPASVPTIADVREAARRIAGQAVRTPLHRSPFLDAQVGGRIFFKCENLQRTGSFKFRGAYNALSVLSRETRERGVVAVSSGNHAQGVAEAARLFGVRATIFMPSDAPAIKRMRTERSGARIISYDRASEDREALTLSFIAEHGGTLVHPFNDFNVIAGQGTIGLEIAADCEAAGIVPDGVVCPCGGGGLTSGVSLAIRNWSQDAEMVLVEPDGFDDYGRSLREGKRVANARTSGSVCDSLLSDIPGAIGFAIHQANRATPITVSDAEALAAVAFAFRELKLVVEPGGAVALAAILTGRVPTRGRTLVAVLSGGNIDEPVLARALAAD